MKKYLFSFISLLLLYSVASAQKEAIKFAWISDNHFDSYDYAETDLKRAVDEINADGSLNFVVISGDLTEFGETKEYMGCKNIINKFNKRCIILPGNHDDGWCENGFANYTKIFGPTHCVFDYEGYRFIGIGVGPMMRMGAPCYLRTELEWLSKVIDTTAVDKPIIFVSHYPLDEEITNGQEVIDILKRRNIELILSGHEHANASRQAQGIPVMVCRSMLREKGKDTGGYNIVTIVNNKATFNERLIGERTLTAWASIPLTKYEASKDTFSSKHTISYAINKQYPYVKEVWRINEPSDISAQAAIDGNFYVYTTISGCVVAINAMNGKELWRFKTTNMIHSAPFITSSGVFVSSCDGYIYSINRKNGRLKWKVNTQYPIVACPLVVDNTLYIGSSNGKFYAFDAQTGKNKWTTNGLIGFIEARPTIDTSNVYIGTWGAKFYAFNRKTGVKAWEFDTGRGRYFTPGACWPVTIGDKIFMYSTDYYLRAFGRNGKVEWQTNAPKGREAIGISGDKRTIYVQGIGNNITAYDLTKDGFPQKWEIRMPYKENFVPTRLGINGKKIYIASAFGIIYAISDNGSGVIWQYKISNSAITSFATTPDKAIIAMTMDGKIVKLKEDTDFDR
jgi:outer membrane protein assembly factor BamB/calcineurin-like phosphoesterase family protein